MEVVAIAVEGELFVIGCQCHLSVGTAAAGSVEPSREACPCFVTESARGAAQTDPVLQTEHSTFT